MIPFRAFLIPLAVVALIVMAGRAHADDGYTCADPGCRGERRSRRRGE